MARYLFEYVDSHDRRSVDFVEANSVADARQRIAEVVGQRGLRLGTLLDDDLMAQLRLQRPAVDGLTPQALARIEVITREGGSVWSLFRESVVANRWLILVGMGALAGGIAFGLLWLAVVGGVALLALLAVFAVAQFRSHDYKQLLQASALGDWPEVLRLARGLRDAAAKSPQLAFDLDVRRGIALAATGHLGEAVTLISKWHLQDVQPKGIYWGRLATVYHAGRDYRQFVACMRRSFAESRLAVWARIDFALAIARLGDEPREALDLLRHDSLDGQPEATQRFILWARGMALLRLGDPVGAEAALTPAVRSFATQVANPAVWSALALCTAALAVAMAENGRREDARQLLAPVARMVAVLADQPLAELLKAKFTPVPA
jgi:hypothetical protein